MNPDGTREYTDMDRIHVMKTRAQIYNSLYSYDIVKYQNGILTERQNGKDLENKEQYFKLYYVFCKIKQEEN